MASISKVPSSAVPSSRQYRSRQAPVQQESGFGSEIAAYSVPSASGAACQVTDVGDAAGVGVPAPGRAPGGAFLVVKPRRRLTVVRHG